MIAIRDPAGRALGYLDARVDAPARDVNGKPVADAAPGAEDKMRQLADTAAARMSGRPVLMDLGPADVVQPATQATFGIPEASEYLSDLVSPVRLVKQDRGFWFVEDTGDALKLVVEDAAAAGGYVEVHPAFNKTAFTCLGHALGVKLPRQLMANADFDIKQRAVRRLVDGLRRLRERRVATQLTTAANWAASNRVAAVANWNGGATANPLTDVFAALKASYLPANVLVLPESAATSFHVASVQTFLQAGGQLPTIVYARAKQMVAGATAYVWDAARPTNAALVRTVHDLDNDIPSSVTFRWLNPDGAQSEGIEVRQFVDKADDSTWVVCVHNDVEVQVSTNVGAVITGALT